MFVDIDIFAYQQVAYCFGYSFLCSCFVSPSRQCRQDSDFADFLLSHLYCPHVRIISQQVDQSDGLDKNFFIAATASILLDKSLLQWEEIFVGMENVGAANDPITLTNVGNVDIADGGVSITASDLVASGGRIEASRFTVHTSDLVDCGGGSGMSSIGDEIVGGAFVDRQGTEELFFCILDVGEGTRSDVYLSESSWFVNVG